MRRGKQVDLLTTPPVWLGDGPESNDDCHSEVRGSEPHDSVGIAKRYSRILRRLEPVAPPHVRGQIRRLPPRAKALRGVRTTEA
jgi:hypothetical protein